MDTLQIIAEILGTLSIWEATRYLINRNTNKRKEVAEAKKQEAEASTSEFSGLREYNEFLQKQLIEKEERFVEQTNLLRQKQTEVLELTKEKGQLELELQRYRCVRKGCPNREPQNGF